METNVAKQTIENLRAWTDTQKLTTPSVEQTTMVTTEVTPISDDLVAIYNPDGGTDYISKESYDALTPEEQIKLNAVGLAIFNEDNKAKYEQAVSLYKASIVTLPNGDVVNKKVYDALSTAEQTLLNQVGVEAYNNQKTTEYTQAIEAYQASVVTLSNGDVVSKSDYDSLSDSDKQLLNNLGINGFNAAKQSESETAIAEFKASIVKLATGEIVDKTAYEALSDEDKALLNRLGINDYTQVKSEDYARAINKYEESTVVLSNGDVVDKVVYNNLLPEDRDLLNSVGLEQYNVAKATEYGKQIEAYNATVVTLSTGEIIDKIEYDKLSDSDKQLLNFAGLDEFNAIQKDLQKKQLEAYEANTITLATGQKVDKTEYESLSDEDKELLNRLGLGDFNQYKKEENERAISKYEASIITLDNGEIVDREIYNTLSATDQSSLKQLGIVAFNKKKENELNQQLVNYQASVVTLSTGETVDKSSYDALSATDQASLAQLGIEKYNQKKQDEINAQVVAYKDSTVALTNGERIDSKTYYALSDSDKALLNQLGVTVYNQQKEQQAAVYAASVVTLATGETIDKAGYDALSIADKALLNQLGIEKYNQQKQNEYNQQVSAYEASIVTLSNGDIIEKTAYNELSATDQALLMRLGVSGYNQQKQSEYNAELQTVQAQQAEVSHAEWLLAPIATTTTNEQGQSVTAYDFSKLTQKGLEDAGIRAAATLLCGADSLQKLDELAAENDKIYQEILSDTNVWQVEDAFAVIDQSKIVAEPAWRRILLQDRINVSATWDNLSEQERIRVLRAYNPESILTQLRHAAAIIPFIGTALNWNDMSSTSKGISIATDLLFFIPTVKAIGAIGRSVLETVKPALKETAIIDRAVSAIAKTENTIVKQQSIIVEETFGTKVADGYRTIAKTQSELVDGYAQLAKAERLGTSIASINKIEKTVMSTELKLQQEVKAYQTAIKESGVAIGASDKAGIETLERMSTDVVKNVRETFQSTVQYLEGSKGAIVKLEKQLTAAQEKLSAAKLWEVKATDVKNITSELRIARQSITPNTTLIQQIESRLKVAQNELASAKYNPQQMIDAMREVSEVESKLQVARVGSLEDVYNNLLKVRQLKVTTTDAKTLTELSTKEKSLSELLTKNINRMYGEEPPKYRLTKKDTSGNYPTGGGGGTAIKSVATEARTSQSLLNVGRQKIVLSNELKTLLDSYGSEAPDFIIQKIMSKGLATFALATETARILGLVFESNASTKEAFLNSVQLADNPILANAIRDWDSSVNTVSKIQVAVNQVLDAKLVESTSLQTVGGTIKPSVAQITSVSQIGEKGVISTKANQIGAKGKVSAKEAINLKAKESIGIQPALTTGIAVNPVTGILEQTTIGIKPETTVGIKAEVSTAVSAKPIASTSPSPNAKPEVETKPEVKTKPELKTETKTQLKTETKTETKTKTKLKKEVTIGNGGEIIGLTPEELKASVAWKQGVMYKLVFPPYNQEDIINSPYPFKGIEIKPDAKTAMETMVRVNVGYLPTTIYRDMGIFDVTITTGKGKSSKPKISYKLDKKQKTKAADKQVWNM